MNSKNIYRGACGKFHDRRTVDLACATCAEHAEWRAERQASLPTLAELVGQLAALTPDFTKNEALR